MTALAGVLVREVSDFYPNRGASVLGRVYLDTELPAPCGVVPADAERTDPPTRPEPRALTRRTTR